MLRSGLVIAWFASTLLFNGTLLFSMISQRSWAVNECSYQVPMVYYSSM